MLQELCCSCLAWDLQKLPEMETGCYLSRHMTVSSALLEEGSESCPFSGPAAASRGRMGLFSACLSQENHSVLSDIPSPWSLLGFVRPSHGKSPQGPYCWRGRLVRNHLG